MADLDDFFAKKDRKKANKGKKFTTTEEIAKKLEETGKRPEKIKPKEIKPGNPEEEEVAQPVPEDDEWLAFEEEKKDYSGLKIGNLNPADNNDAESDEERVAGENSSDGEGGESGAKHSGPWKKPDLPESKESTEATSAAAVAAAAPVESSYKAPHLRNSGSSSSTRSRLMRNVAPDINSEEYFPTLSGRQAQSAETGPWARRKREEGSFEEVRNRGGSRGYGSLQESHQAQAPKLSLGNKYGALSQDQS